MFQSLKGYIPPHHGNRRTHFPGLLQDNLQGLTTGRRHQGHPFFYDASLHKGYLTHGVAQVFHVVHGHIGNDRHQGQRHVGGVNGASQAHLQHQEVHLLPVKIDKSEGCAHFKLRWVFKSLFNHVLQVGPQFINNIRHGLLRNRPPVYGVSFCISMEVRRRVCAHTVPGFPQYGMQHGGGRSLAIGAAHVNDPQLAVWIVESSQQLSYPAQTKIKPKLGKVLHILNGLTVIHLSPPFTTGPTSLYLF